MHSELPVKKTILLVEDDEFIRGAIRNLLELDGYLVNSAANGKAALDQLGKFPQTCLVLLDLQMPVMNGLEFLDALKLNQKFCKIPVIVVSASEMDHQTRHRGAKAFLKKGSDLPLLLKTVKEFCHRSWLH